MTDIHIDRSSSATPWLMIAVLVCVCVLLSLWVRDRYRVSSYNEEVVAAQAALEESLDSLDVERERRRAADKAAEEAIWELEGERFKLVEAAQFARQRTREAAGALDIALGTLGLTEAAHDSLRAILEVERAHRDTVEEVQAAEVVVVDSLCSVCRVQMGVRENELAASNTAITVLERRFELEVARNNPSWPKRAFNVASLGMAFWLGVKVGD